MRPSFRMGDELARCVDHETPPLFSIDSVNVCVCVNLRFFRRPLSASKTGDRPALIFAVQPLTINLHLARSRPRLCRTDGCSMRGRRMRGVNR